MKRQKQLALHLLDWHGGQGSSLYAVGSCMLSAADKGEKYNPENYGGHLNALPLAIRELKGMKAGANFPDCVNQDECDKLAERLEKYLPR
jgi:hypothetical protein